MENKIHSMKLWFTFSELQLLRVKSLESMFSRDICAFKINNQHEMYQKSECFSQKHSSTTIVQINHFIGISQEEISFSKSNLNFMAI